MPIYEYECGSCQHRLEIMQKISDERLRDCPHCHRPDLRKLVSATAFRLKGGGWYETDFKTGGKKNLSGDAGSGAGGGASSAAADGAAGSPAAPAAKPAAEVKAS
jgi:putative FmdB family regulatory protein